MINSVRVSTFNVLLIEKYYYKNFKFRENSSTLIGLGKEWRNRYKLKIIRILNVFVTPTISRRRKLGILFCVKKVWSPKVTKKKKTFLIDKKITKTKIIVLKTTVSILLRWISMIIHAYYRKRPYNVFSATCKCTRTVVI